MPGCCLSPSSFVSVRLLCVLFVRVTFCFCFAALYVPLFWQGACMMTHCGSIKPVLVSSGSVPCLRVVMLQVTSCLAVPIVECSAEGFPFSVLGSGTPQASRPCPQASAKRTQVFASISRCSCGHHLRKCCRFWSLFAASRVKSAKWGRSRECHPLLTVPLSCDARPLLERCFFVDCETIISANSHRDGVPPVAALVTVITFGE